MTHTPSALVTGATRGIGRAIADRLAADGWALTLVARNADALADTADALRAAGSPDVLVCPADLSDADSAAAPIAAHGEKHGSMDALILNAGMGLRAPFADMPLRRFDKLFAINVRAPFVMMQAATPLLAAAAEARPDKGAKVVALASSTGVYAEEGYAAYGASKAALISMLETYTIEHSASGVMATTLSPGYVDTDMTDWVDEETRATMLSAEDLAVMTTALLDLSSRAFVKNITLTRAGTPGYGA